MTRVEMFTELKYLSKILDIKFDAKYYFSFSNQRLKFEILRLNDIIDDFEETSDYKIYKAL